MAVMLMDRIWAASVRAQPVETRLEAQLLLLEDFYLLCWLVQAFVCAERMCLIFLGRESDGRGRVMAWKKLTSSRVPSQSL